MFLSLMTLGIYKRYINDASTKWWIMEAFHNGIENSALEITDDGYFWFYI